MPDYARIAEGVEVPEEFLGPISRELGRESGEEGEREGETSPPPPEAKQYRVSDPKYQGLAAEKGYSQHHARIQKTRYSHEAMIDIIVAEPTIKQNELATRFEKSVGWISRIIGSDAFQAALAKRREELTDPFLVATIEERFKGLAMQSLDVIVEKLESSKNADLAMKALDISSKALGFGARAPSGSGNVTNFVVQLPAKAADSADWSANHAGGRLIEG